MYNMEIYLFMEQRYFDVVSLGYRVLKICMDFFLL